MRLVNNELKTTGEYSMEINGMNYQVVYIFTSLKQAKFVQTKRMDLIK